MPVVSEAQRRAMAAASHGRSALGIPRSVGAEYIAATPKGKHLPEHVSKKKTHKRLGDSF